jgi:acetyl esterase/lipase
MKMIHIPIPNHPEATLEGYILDCELALGQEYDRPAVVVLPGGGYAYCCPREAEPVALKYAASGFHAFLLRYSTGWDAADFSPLAEVSWVIGYLRENAKQWHIDPKKIAVCGFSAGGHLALASGTMGENKPNAMILGYPAVNIPNFPGVNFMLQLLTGRKEVTDADAAYLSLESKIDANTPPAFLVATAEDMLTGYGALPVAKKYAQLGLGYELHIFQHGAHGYALAEETSADGSSRYLNPAFAQWQELSVQWLRKVFGKPELTDKSTSRMMGHIRQLGFQVPDKLGRGF